VTSTTAYNPFPPLADAGANNATSMVSPTPDCLHHTRTQLLLVLMDTEMATHSTAGNHPTRNRSSRLECTPTAQSRSSTKTKEGSLATPERVQLPHPNATRMGGQDKWVSTTEKCRGTTKIMAAGNVDSSPLSAVEDRLLFRLRKFSRSVPLFVRAGCASPLPPSFSLLWSSVWSQPASKHG
jgi:hypothetical protein